MSSWLVLDSYYKGFLSALTPCWSDLNLHWPLLLQKTWQPGIRQMCIWLAFFKMHEMDTPEFVHPVPCPWGSVVSWKSELLHCPFPCYAVCNVTIYWTALSWNLTLSSSKSTDSLTWHITKSHCLTPSQTDHFCPWKHMNIVMRYVRLLLAI